MRRFQFDSAIHVLGNGKNRNLFRNELISQIQLRINVCLFYEILCFVTIFSNSRQALLQLLKNNSFTTSAVIKWKL